MPTRDRKAATVPRRSINLHDQDGATFTAGMAAIEREQDVPQEFPADVLAAAEEAAASPGSPSSTAPTSRS